MKKFIFILMVISLLNAILYSQLFKNTFNITNDSASIGGSTDKRQRLIATDLFISEYVEGSSHQQAIEIFNGTGTAIDLSTVSLKIQLNGVGDFGNELSLSGTLDNEDVYVIVNSYTGGANLTNEPYVDMATTSPVLTFNGNDVVGLFRSGLLIDVVGIVDLVNNWGTDITLVRDYNIVSPVTNFTFDDWTQYPIDTFAYLGSHYFVFGYANFTDISANLTGVDMSSAAWGDYDNDGDLDIILGGFTGSNSLYISKIYRNDGNNTFININANLLGIARGAVIWGDYDNDGDLDVLLNGHQNSSPYYLSKIYRNDGFDTFTDINANLLNADYSTAAWGDYDNDGDLDILLTGAVGLPPYQTKIYRNNGNSTFTEINTNLTGVARGSTAWGDYDNDGDLDILLTGLTGTNSDTAKVYRNDGYGTFIDINANLIGVSYSSAVWGDYDNDGDLDILLTGASSTSTYRISKVYRNDSGTFTDINANLSGTNIGSAAWGDYNNDGNLDILLTGNASYGTETKIYRNNGNSTFREIDSGLSNLHSSSASWGDYDNDGDLDILIVGSPEDLSPPVSKVFRNDYDIANSPPLSPTNLHNTIESVYVTFTWDSSLDDNTPVSGLNYNLRIGTTPGGCEISSPMSNASGHRFIPQKGYANGNCSWRILHSSLPNNIYWSVQAIDGAFAGSQWATEAFITTATHIDNNEQVTPISGIEGLNCIEKVFPNPFNLSVQITYHLKKSGDVSLSVYNNKGQFIKELVNESKLAGYYQIHWDGRDINNRECSNGLYFVKMFTSKLVSAKKIVLVK